MTVVNVITDQGTAFARATDKTYFRHGDTYLRVDVQYLSPGSRVLWLQEHAKVTFQDVDYASETLSETYRDAKTALLEGREEQFVPRLRANLIRGIAGSSESLEKKIFRIGDDFSSEDYRSMCDLAHDAVTKYAQDHGLKAPIWETVLTWLRGDAIVPEQKRFLYALGQLNPYFQEFADDFADDGKTAQLYKFYIGLRRGMAGSWQVQDGETGKPGEYKPRGNGPYAAEIARIMREYNAAKQSKYVDAIVKDIQVVRRKNEDKVRDNVRRDPTLSRGIYVGDETPEQRTVVSIDVVLTDNRLHGVSSIDNPEGYMRTLKELCIDHGFPLRMMHAHIMDRIQPYEQFQVTILPPGSRMRPEGGYSITYLPGKDLSDGKFDSLVKELAPQFSQMQYALPYEQLNAAQRSSLLRTVKIQLQHHRNDAAQVRRQQRQAVERFTLLADQLLA